MSKFKTIKASPGAKRLIESLRGLGYECPTAISDIVDNSISAGASEVHVDIIGLDGDEPAVVISDNGEGMDRDTLVNAMRFGAEQDYSTDDLGKFGLGLKTASLSQCRKLTVASKPIPARGSKSRRNVMRWDLDHVYSKDEWELHVLEDNDLEEDESKLIRRHLDGANGTVVLWTDLKESMPLLYSKDQKKRERFLAQLLSDVETHLSMVFHRFMQGRVSGNRRLKIYLGGNLLEPWDPFCISEANTESLRPSHLKIEDSSGNGKVTVSPYILPKEKTFSTPEKWRKAAGPRGWNLQQGFYFYRNGRLLQAGGWSYLRAPDEHTKLLRIAVDFNTGLDKAFQINVTKMKSKIPDEIWGDLKELVSDWAQRARRAYDKKEAGGRSASRPSSGGSARTSSPTTPPPKGDVKLGNISMSVSNANTTSVAATSGQDGVKLIVPYKHVSATAFHAKKGRTVEQRNALLMLLALLEAVHEGKLAASKIPMEKIKKQIQKLV